MVGDGSGLRVLYVRLLMSGVVLVQLSIQARRQNVGMLYKDLSKRLKKYVYDAWDAEECDAAMDMPV